MDAKCHELFAKLDQQCKEMDQLHMKVVEAEAMIQFHSDWIWRRGGKEGGKRGNGEWDGIS